MSGSFSSTGSRSDDSGFSAIRAIAVATGSSTSGSVLNTVAVLSYTYATTGAPVPLGLAVVSGFLPVAVLMPAIGRRLPVGLERRTVLLAVVAQAVGAAVMAALSTTNWLYAMFGLVAVMGVLAMVTRISLLCLVPQLVGSEHLAAANLRLQVAAQIGAAVGASALAVRGQTASWILFLVDAASFAVQAVLLAPILPASARLAGSGTRPGQMPALVGRWRWALVLALLPAGFFALNLLNAVIPLLALHRLHDGQRGLAAAEVVYPVAAVTIGFVLRRKARVPMPVALLGLAAGFAVLAAADRMALLLAGVGVLGAAVVLSNSTTQAWAQAMVPGHALQHWQSRAAAFGAAASTGGVLAASVGFADGRQLLVLGLVAAVFIGLAGLAVVATQRERAWT